MDDQPTGNVAVTADPDTYVLPTMLLMLGAMLLVVSIFLPYWQMTLHAPQYPDGLHVQLYVNNMEGDVREIDGLNHYIGMPKLEEAGKLERSFSFLAIGALALLLIGAVFMHSPLAAVLALPAVAYPLVFLADLFYWLYTFGHNLDPSAPLSNSIKPFTPAILGTGTIGQFRTVARVDIGFYLAILASVIILLGLYFHRAAYLPLRQAQANAQKTEA
jgi:copper chaperone NosL